ncbi:MAG: IclR family transcriptional regulator [Candidatus Marinimicrobia bacterium]|jgi:IclR family pca regulon transcriptional regulator|nr:IclR family transcriptional regulator [Candidatus Neomarinimicrobiota bacterium]|tara:strand:+ start:731 stop:1492 length:762 start_codon:yes stop_codon:yes gene_type:complete
MTRNYLSGSIKKALAIIECVGKSPRPLKSSEVANLTQLERATAFRILTYLTSLGYLFKDITNNLYSLGHKIFEFGDKSDFLKTLTSYSIDHIRDLSRETQLITYLAVLEGPHIVYCDKVGPSGETVPRAFRMRLDAHSCALGKAMLAYKSFEELKEIYKSYTLHKHTENTITSLEKLYMQLRKVRSNGYSTNEAETFNYVYGVGAPILDKQNRAIAAISLSGTKSTINIKTIPILAEKITKTSERISLIISDN